MFYDAMSDEHQGQNICKVAFFHIRNLLKSGNVVLRKIPKR